MTTTTDPGLQLLPPSAVAELLGCSVRTLWRWAARGTVPPPVRLSARCIRWRASDLRRYLDALAREAAS